MKTYEPGLYASYLKYRLSKRDKPDGSQTPELGLSHIKYCVHLPGDIA